MTHMRPYFKNNKLDYGEILNAGKNVDINLLKQKSNESGIPVNIADENNNNLFHLALMNSSVKSESKIINFFKYLMTENTSPDMMNIDGLTPLHIACKRQSRKVVDYLLEIGCDINSIDNKGLYPIDYMLKGKYKSFKKDKSISDLYKIELKKDIVDNSLINEIYDEYIKYVDTGSDKAKLSFGVIKKFITNSLLNDCSRELYIIYKSDLTKSSVIKENIKTIQTKIVDKLLNLNDIKSIDNFESLKNTPLTGGADSKNTSTTSSEDKNELNKIYEELKKIRKNKKNLINLKRLNNLFDEIDNLNFKYNMNDTELFDELYNSVYTDKDENKRLITYGYLIDNTASKEHVEKTKKRLDKIANEQINTMTDMLDKNNIKNLELEWKKYEIEKLDLTVKMAEYNREINEAGAEITKLNGDNKQGIKKLTDEHDQKIKKLTDDNKPTILDFNNAFPSESDKKKAIEGFNNNNKKRIKELTDEHKQRIKKLTDERDQKINKLTDDTIKQKNKQVEETKIKIQKIEKILDKIKAEKNTAESAINEGIRTNKIISDKIKGLFENIRININNRPNILKINKEVGKELVNVSEELRNLRDTLTNLQKKKNILNVNMRIKKSDRNKETKEEIKKTKEEIKKMEEEIKKTKEEINKVMLNVRIAQYKEKIITTFVKKFGENLDNDLQVKKLKDLIGKENITYANKTTINLEFNDNTDKISKYDEFKTKYLKKVIDVLNTYISKVDKVEELYYFALNMGYKNSTVDKVEKKVLNSEFNVGIKEQFLNVRGVARNLIKFIRIARLYNPEKDDKNINVIYHDRIKNNYGRLEPIKLNSTTNTLEKVDSEIRLSYLTIGKEYNKPGNFKLAGLNCSLSNYDKIYDKVATQKTFDCLEYSEYDKSNLENFYNNLISREDDNSPHISFWKKLKKFFNAKFEEFVKAILIYIRQYINRNLTFENNIIILEKELFLAKKKYINTLKKNIKNNKKNVNAVTKIDLINLINKSHLPSLKTKYLPKQPNDSNSLEKYKSTKGHLFSSEVDNGNIKLYYKDNNFFVEKVSSSSGGAIKHQGGKIIRGGAGVIAMFFVTAVGLAIAKLGISATNDAILKHANNIIIQQQIVTVNALFNGIDIDEIYNYFVEIMSNKIILFKDNDYSDSDIFNDILSVKNPSNDDQDKLNLYKQEYMDIPDKNVKKLYNWCIKMKEYYDNNKDNMVCNKLFVDTINYLKLKKLKKLHQNKRWLWGALTIKYKDFLFELAKSIIINDIVFHDVNNHKKILLTLSYITDTGMINFLNINQFRYIYNIGANAFNDDILKDEYGEQLHCILHDSLNKVFPNNKTNLDTRENVYKKDMENIINKHNSKQYDNYLANPDNIQFTYPRYKINRKYIIPTTKEHDIFFCYKGAGDKDIVYNSYSTIFFDDIMKIGPIKDLMEDNMHYNPKPKYNYQFLKYNPNFKRFLKESYKQFINSNIYKSMILNNSTLSKTYTVYEIQDVNNNIKDKLIERTYYDILEYIKNKISNLIVTKREELIKNIPNKNIIGGEKKKFKTKLSLRDKVMCELEMKDKARLYEIIGGKKTQFIIYSDDYTITELEQNFLTFNIKENIINKLLEYNPTIDYKKLKYIISNKYNLLNNTKKSTPKTISPSYKLDITYDDNINFYKCIKENIKKELDNHFKKYYIKDDNNSLSIKSSIEYFTSNMYEDIEELISNSDKYTNIFNFNKTGFMIMHYLTNQYFTQYIDKNITNEYDISTIKKYANDTEYFNSINNINELEHIVKKLKLKVIKLENITHNDNISKKIKELENSIDSYKNKTKADVKKAAANVKKAAAANVKKAADDVKKTAADVTKAANKIKENKDGNISIQYNKKLLTSYHTDPYMEINMLDAWNDLLHDSITIKKYKYLWLYKNINSIKCHIKKLDDINDINDIKSIDQEIAVLEEKIQQLQKKVYHYNILYERAKKIHDTIPDNYTLPEDMLGTVDYDNVGKKVKYMKGKTEKEKVCIMREEYKKKLVKYNKELKEKKTELIDKNTVKKTKEAAKKTSKDKLKDILKKFKKLHNRGKMYFEESPFYLQNKARCFLYELLNYVVQLVIGNNMKTYLLRILYHNRSKEETKDLDSIFTSYKVFNKYSLIEHLQAQSMDMIKSSIDLFENETEKENYEKKSISTIIQDAIDTFILERNAFDDKKIKLDEAELFGIDGNIVESLENSKKILGEYFESFIPQYIKNLVAVYENNMKFVINHYRLLDMYMKSIDMDIELS